ncbi:hypothetical protein QTP88_019035 [Uroleucon formosanum]
MVQNDEDTQCKSVRCCCKLISKSEEKPATAVVATKPRNNGCGGHAEHPQKMSLCDFLKSQPIPDWIKVNDVHSQQHQNQKRPVQPCAPDKPKGSSLPEDVVSSQIIINFGTVVTNGACKRDSCQQTDPEVQQPVYPTTASPPVNRSTSSCPPAKRSTSKICPEPANRSTTTCSSANRLTTTCPPANQSTTTCPPTERPTSFCPEPATEPPAIPARDRCSQEKSPRAAMSSSPPKARPECVVKNIKCECTCHSDV